MKLRVVVLGAGFGGLELSSMLSEEIGDDLDLTLIDKNDSFVFGFSKLDLIFGHVSYNDVLLKYEKIDKRGVRFRQEVIETIDPVARQVTTNRATYVADILVVALGADYNIAATPGLESANEFYTVEGARRVSEMLPRFSKGKVIVGVCGIPFKCPPAPSEAVLLLHDYFTARGIRDMCEISLVMPFPVPIPASVDASQALLAAFAERSIKFVPESTVVSLDPKRKLAILDNGREISYELFLGVPVHRVPDVVARSGMTEDGWIPVSSENLKTRFPGVYAVGDVTEVEVPKAGLFSEGAARVAATSIIADLEKGPQPRPYDGAGACYVEFGSKMVGRVDVNFLSAEAATGRFTKPSIEVASEKIESASKRRLRWFGLGD
jgi:sulfide:quinone oxidoreductase